MNIVLLGGSNSVYSRALNFGLNTRNKEGIFNINKYSLGATASAHRIYSIIRNYDVIKEAKFIIVDSYLNDVLRVNEARMPVELVLENIEYMYLVLYQLNFNVLSIFITSPVGYKDTDVILKKHIYCCKKYGFYYIDLESYYSIKKLKEWNKPFGSHPLRTIMLLLGKNIVDNINLFVNNHGFSIKSCLFKFLNRSIFKHCITPPLQQYQIGSVLDNFYIYIPNDWLLDGAIKRTRKNSFFEEDCIRISENDTVHFFPKNFIGFRILAIHTWNENDNKMMQDNKFHTNCYAGIKIHNKSKKIVKYFNSLNSFSELHEKIFIDNCTSVEFTTLDQETEETQITKKEYRLNCCDIVCFFLFKESDLKVNSTKYNNFNRMELDCNFLIPPIEYFKEMIEEYNLVLNKK